MFNNLPAIKTRHEDDGKFEHRSDEIGEREGKQEDVEGSAQTFRRPHDRHDEQRVERDA